MTPTKALIGGALLGVVLGGFVAPIAERLGIHGAGGAPGTGVVSAAAMPAGTSTAAGRDDRTTGDEIAARDAGAVQPAAVSSAADGNDR